MKRLFPFFITFIAGIFITSCSTSGVSTTVHTTPQSVTQIANYEGKKARIAVADFKCKAAKCYGRIGNGIRDMLIDALLKSGKFIVLESGEGLEPIKEELNLAESGYIDKKKAVKKGSWEGADIVVTGSIIAFEPRAEGIGGGVGIFIRKVPLIGGVKLSKGEAYIAVNIRLIDIRTRRVINSTIVEGRASNINLKGITIGIIGIPLATGLSMYKNTPMEKAIMIMISKAVNEISKLVPDEYYKYK